MVNLNKLSKKEFGRLLLPEKIYRLKFKEELESLHEKLYFDNLNPIVISNLFFVGIIMSIIGYIIAFPYLVLIPGIGEFLKKQLESGILSRTLVIFVTYFVSALFSYYAVLLAYFLMHDSKFKKNEYEIEKNLPEFIDNLVSNIKGGIPLERALLKSVRKEQKALLREVTLINEKVMMGKNVAIAMKEFRNRFDSPIISRTFFLIEEGVKGGGNLAAPLARISENLKNIYSLEEEIKGNSSGFAVVIRGITLIVAPLLFALALTLLTFIGNLFDLLAKTTVQLSFVQPIPDEFAFYLLNFSYAMLILITLFSSLITSQLKNERTYTALKYLPVYIAIVLVLFQVFSNLLLGWFGNVI